MMLKLPPLTPMQRKVRTEQLAEIALLRTAMQYGQTVETRARAMARLRELGVDPTRKETK